MISKILLDNVATYKEVNFNPSKVNYIYGGNGTGKTTISKVIANENIYPYCEIEKDDTEIDICVYNRDFLKKNFSQSNSVKGIFTLGKNSKDAQEFIEMKKDELEKLKEKNNKFENSKEILEEEITKENQDFENKMWEIKKEYESEFREAFEGYMSSKKKFSEKCLGEFNNSSELLRFQDLVERKNLVFKKDVIKYEQISIINFEKLRELEQSEILSTPIIGKENSQFGMLIKKLKNSDWVNKGREYLKNSESQCPFCQQPINRDIIRKIEEFFDDSYKEQFGLINDFKEEYCTLIKTLINNLKELRTQDIEIIDLSILDEKIKIIEEKNKVNLMKINEKIDTPSNIIKLEKITDVIQEINTIITDFQKMIEKNNNLIENIKSEKNKLINQIWRFIVERNKNDIKRYKSSISGYKKGVKNINNKIKNNLEDSKAIDKEIKLKEAEITNTEHTKNEINKILKIFGFVGFKIENAEKEGKYKIIRNDGSPVEETLSEGEYNFITFLYFYQMIKGSTDPTGITRDKVIVIDDPVSSLDSNILFIVSSLVKNIVNDCNNGKNGIKQVLLFTHNVYFYKEVTFRGSNKELKKHEKFWIIKKIDELSKIEKHDENPIQTTYEMLWEEIRDKERINKVSVFNTLRRILEYYFNIIGGLDYEKCIHSFEGEDKLVCKALISWINDGSHFVNDDTMIYLDPESIEKYLKVFKMIFDNMGHISHYYMMMKIDY
ncbi:AAA family ATPase [Geotoga petraea]|uniref:ATP-binding protein n=1 Tax=Geotoga petraea TaxID=28234 RepID=A0A4Z0W133_9BACT|nr:AAA family ATPase [Geotoga petraea]TGG87504.1 ATP-binding protein [Geotoga petraea]